MLQTSWKLHWIWMLASDKFDVLFRAWLSLGRMNNLRCDHMNLDFAITLNSSYELTLRKRQHQENYAPS